MNRLQLGLAALAFGVLALGSSEIALARTDAAKAGTVVVTAGKPNDFRFTLSRGTVAKGAVTFKVTNKGALTHDFKIAGHVTKMLKHGQSATLRVVFKKAGRYPYECTVPGHAAAGMKGVLKVT
jgi:uncharacterized cupredoxin-like copper-binding protein